MKGVSQDSYMQQADLWPVTPRRSNEQQLAISEEQNNLSTRLNMSVINI